MVISTIATYGDGVKATLLDHPGYQKMAMNWTGNYKFTCTCVVDMYHTDLTWLGLEFESIQESWFEAFT